VKKVCIHGRSKRKKALRKAQKKKAARTRFYSDLTIAILATYGYFALVTKLRMPFLYFGLPPARRQS